MTDRQPPAPPLLLLPAPELVGVEQVVAEPLRFKAKLAIGEDAYQSLRMVNRAREMWDVLGATAAGAAVAKSGLVASTFFVGSAATPIGWVAVAALASGGACYGMYRLLSSSRGERVIEIPKYLNTPLDTLGLAMFDLIAPLSLRLAAVDGQVEPAERDHLTRHLVDEWGLNRAFVEQALVAIEPGLAGSSLEALATEGAGFLHLNPDCNHRAIAADLGQFLRAMLQAGGPLTVEETEALDTVVRLLAVEPPSELSKAWSKTVDVATDVGGQAAGQAKAALAGAAGWTQERLPSLDQVKAQAGETATQALDAARKAAAWTQERLPSAEQVKGQAVQVGTQAAQVAQLAQGKLGTAAQALLGRVKARAAGKPDKPDKAGPGED